MPSTKQKDVPRSGTLQYGAFQAVNACMGIKPGERVFIISDRARENIGSAIFDEAVRAAADPGLVRMVLLEDYGQRPFDRMPARLEEQLRDFKPAATLYVATGQEGEIRFRLPLLTLLPEVLNARHGHMINVTEQIMGDGMCSDYARVAEISQRVFDAVRNAKRIRVTTDAGTDLVANFHPDPQWRDGNGATRERWVILNGTYRVQGRWGNLPEGEVFTCPHSVNGVLVIDGVLGDHFTKKYGLLKHAVTATIRDSRAVIGSISCADKVLESEFKEYLLTAENSDRVGEFAIGTNVGLRNVIGNLLQDEKFPGIHIAFGNTDRGQTGADWEAETHVDGVLLKPTVEVDGKTIMEKGNFLMGLADALRG